MIYEVIKPPKRQSDWEGLRVRAVREIQTGVVSIPKGCLGTVQYVSGGLIRIIFDACNCCGVAARLRWKRVDDPNLIEFVAPVKEDGNG